MPNLNQNPLGSTATADYTGLPMDAYAAIKMIVTEARKNQKGYVPQSFQRGTIKPHQINMLLNRSILRRRFVNGPVLEILAWPEKTFEEMDQLLAKRAEEARRKRAEDIEKSRQATQGS